MNFDISSQSSVQTPAHSGAQLTVHASPNFGLPEAPQVATTGKITNGMLIALALIAVIVYLRR